MSEPVVCPDCGEKPSRASGSATAGIRVFYCANGHHWVTTTWSTP